ncbi:hypothetical protein [Novipirellula caenicola]|uniref:Uncharacterized protein n=1 Tax=Novipirellula caenicola TaxID=1536901 RepID=A0ABP9W1C2_9BACT
MRRDVSVLHPREAGTFAEFRRTKIEIEVRGSREGVTTKVAVAFRLKAGNRRNTAQIQGKKAYQEYGGDMPWRGETV